MPTITVNGVTLAYEVFGQGSPLVYSAHGWFPRDNVAYSIAGRLSAHFRVLLWDRRNSGASGVAFVDSCCEHDLWAEDLHQLLAALRMSPAYLIGACNGAALSLLLALRYPGDVRGLVLLAPPRHYTAATEEVAFIFDGYFHRLAEVAEARGMAAVISESTDAWVRLGSGRWGPRDWFLNWVAQTISMNPGNRDRVLATDPEAFAALMRRWANWYYRGVGHIHGVPYEDIRSLSHPALVAHGFDPIHPRDTAEELHQVLRNSQWVEYSEKYTKEQMEQAGYSWSLALPFIEDFVRRTETQ